MSWRVWDGWRALQTLADDLRSLSLYLRRQPELGAAATGKDMRLATAFAPRGSFP